ncbi:hypothetical protein CRYUN_Cryun04dG0019300 [Craigia yunnanensis]
MSNATCGAPLQELLLCIVPTTLCRLHQQMAGRSSRTIYVGNLPLDVKEWEIEDLFYKYGRILDIELKLPPRPPGYCFVEFEDPLDAEDAIKGRDGYNFDGSRIRVELAHGGRGQSSRRGYGGGVGGGGSSGDGGRGRFGVSHRSEFRVVVRGLPSSASWQDLKDHMRKAGDVCFAEVSRDGDGAMGIVDYTNYDDMKYAIRKLDDSEFRNPFARAYIRVKCYEGSPGGGRSRSRSLSGSPRSNRRSVSKSRSPSPARLSRISQKGSGEDIVVYRILLDSLYDNGKVEEGLEFLGKVLRKGLKAPKSRRERLDLSKCINAEDSEATKRLINEVLLRGGVPNMGSYSVMAIDLYKEGRVDKAEKVLHEIRKKGFWPSLLMYEAKAQALCKKGRVSEVVKVIEEDIKEGTCVPDVRLNNIVLKCLCDAGDSELAVGHLKKMAKQVGSIADKETYSILVNGLCKDGKFVEASRLLEEMLIKSHWPGAETYTIVIRGFCSIGRQYEAVMLEEMVRQGMLPDLSIWNSLVASVCCKMTDINVFCEGILTQ